MRFALSFRVGQMYGSQHNTPGVATDFSVVLVDSAGKSSLPVSAGAFGDLSYPDQGAVAVGGDWAATAKSAMRTVRIPLEYFVGAKLSKIERIEFRFDAGKAANGEVLVDNLEFVD